MIVWIIILLSHLVSAGSKAAELPVRMPWFPAVQITGLTLLCAVLVTMGSTRKPGVSRDRRCSMGCY